MVRYLRGTHTGNCNPRGPQPSFGNHFTQALSAPIARGGPSAPVAAGHHASQKSRHHKNLYHDSLGQIRATYRSLNSSLEHRLIQTPLWRRIGGGNLCVQSGASPDNFCCKQANNSRWKPTIIRATSAHASKR